MVIPNDPSENPLIAAMAAAMAGASRKPSPEEIELQRLGELRQRYQFLLNPALPEACWNVSGVFVNDAILGLFHDFFLSNHGLRLFSGVHGAPLSLWSGGQLRRQFMVDASGIGPIMRSYADRSIAVELAFTNCLLKEEHLQDARGNFLLENLATHNPGGNGVIVTSDRLAGHVRRHYPELRLIAGETKADEEDGRGREDYYRRQAEVYDRVVIHPDDNLNRELLAKLEDKARYEIIVNNPCRRHCQLRQTHGRMLSALAQKFFDSELERRIAKMCSDNGCSDPHRLLFSQDQRTLMLSDREIQELYNLGFRHFKILGRDQADGTALVLDIFRLLFNHEPDVNHLVARTLEELMRMMPRRTGG